jgi:hypothetical protein
MSAMQEREARYIFLLLRVLERGVVCFLKKLHMMPSIPSIDWHKHHRLIFCLAFPQDTREAHLLKVCLNACLRKSSA